MYHFYSKYGKLEKCSILRTDEISRGFGFIVYSTIEEANKVLSSPRPHIICGKEVDFKPALKPDLLPIPKNSVEKTLKRQRGNGKDLRFPSFCQKGMLSFAAYT